MTNEFLTNGHERYVRIQHVLIDLLAFVEHDHATQAEVLVALNQDLNRAGAFEIHRDPRHGDGVECIPLLLAVNSLLFKMMEIVHQTTEHSTDDVRAWLRANLW